MYVRSESLQIDTWYMYIFGLFFVHIQVCFHIYRLQNHMYDMSTGEGKCDIKIFIDRQIHGLFLVQIWVCSQICRLQSHAYNTRTGECIRDIRLVIDKDMLYAQIGLFFVYMGLFQKYGLQSHAYDTSTWKRICDIRIVIDRYIIYAQNWSLFCICGSVSDIQIIKSCI